jgi:hypothetical protein
VLDRITPSVNLLVHRVEIATLTHQPSVASARGATSDVAATGVRDGRSSMTVALGSRPCTDGLAKVPTGSRTKLRLMCRMAPGRDGRSALSRMPPR